MPFVMATRRVVSWHMNVALVENPSPGASGSEWERATSPSVSRSIFAGSRLADNV